MANTAKPTDTAALRELEATIRKAVSDHHFYSGSKPEWLHRAIADATRTAMPTFLPLCAEVEALREGNERLRAAWQSELAIRPCEGGPTDFTVVGIRYVLRTFRAQFDNESELLAQARRERDEAQESLRKMTEANGQLVETFFEFRSALEHYADESRYTRVKGRSAIGGEVARRAIAHVQEMPESLVPLRAQVAKLTEERDEVFARIAQIALRAQGLLPDEMNAELRTITAVASGMLLTFREAPDA